MEIKLNEEQYRDLIHLVVIGNNVLEVLDDNYNGYGEQTSRCAELEEHLIHYANDFNCSDLKASYTDKDDVDDNFFEFIMEEYIDPYDLDVCYDVLSRELGRKELYNTITKEEQKEIEKNGVLPARIFDICDRYQEELEKNSFKNIILKNDNK